jgi:hypothetical protein
MVKLAIPPDLAGVTDFNQSVYEDIRRLGGQTTEWRDRPAAGRNLARAVGKALRQPIR